MGYHVVPSGRLHLPEADDNTAVAAVEAAWALREGRHDQAESPPSTTLVDIAWAAAASIIRDGDWIEFGHDDEGDPKWSDWVTAFFVAIAPFVRSGTVHIEGEDGSRWSYTHAAGQITQRGWNGWDGSIEPFGELVETPPMDEQPQRSWAPRFVMFLVALAVIVGVPVLVSKIH